MKASGFLKILMPGGGGQCCGKSEGACSAGGPVESEKKRPYFRRGHGAAGGADSDRKKIAIVGNPNVGKSVLFNNLTGRYAIVSNYPGTTVEVLRGPVTLGGKEFEVVDTPGMYSISPLTEEESVSRRILINEKPFLVVHVVDAKNLTRMLPMTLQLLEAGFRMILALNMMDEAEKAGIEINLELLERELGIPVVGTVFTSGKGMDALEKRMAEALES